MVLSSLNNVDEILNIKPKTRCAQCNCKINITNSIQCKCDKIFCMKHRFFSDHGCTFDYKTEERKKLAENNPQIVADKLIKI